MHMYETTTRSRRQSAGYAGVVAIILLLAAIFIAWVLM